MAVTNISMELGKDGKPVIVGTWHRDFQLKWGEGNFMARSGGDERQPWWCVADAQGMRFGQAYATLDEVLAEISRLDEQDAEDRNWSWYVGCEWRSDELLGLPDAGDGHESALFLNEDREAGTEEHCPGKAKEAAYKVYEKLCKEPGGCGMVWVGKINPNLPEDDDVRFMEQETCERDPGAEEEYRQERYEQYLEEHHDELVWQDRYEAYKREY